MSSLPPKNKYTVIRDTREHAGHGWVFNPSKDCKGTITAKMETGDYTLEGYEEIFTVDRKGSPGEFVKNLTEKRFEDVLKRMSGYKYAAIILEFSFDELARWPEGPGRKFTRLRKNSLITVYWNLRLKYPHIDFFFVGEHGKEVMSSLFKRMVERYGS